MPTRHETHRTETRGMRAFEYHLPDEWTSDVPAQGNDYGVDATVELFGAEGEALALGFFAQVKATKKKGPKAMSRSIAVETWRHYLRLERPVLLVRYLKGPKELYVRWAHQAIAEMPGPEQKTVTVRWRPEDRWTESTPDQIVIDARRHRAAREAALVRPIEVHAVIRPVDGEHTDHVRALRRTLRDTLRPLGGIVALIPSTGQPSEALVHVQVEGAQVHVDFGGIVQTAVVSPEDVAAPEAAPRIAANAVALASAAAGLAGHDLLAAQLLEHVLATAPIRLSPSFAADAIRILVRANRRDLLVRYVEELFHVARSNPGFLFSATAAVTALRVEREPTVDLETADRLLQSYVDLVEEHGDELSTAAALYTLANHVRQGTQVPARNQRALALFNKARKLDPAYNDRTYFTAEVAATLFDLGRFLTASAWYERTLALGDEEPFTVARWGDALLESGQFADAAEAIAPYVAAPDVLETRPYWWIRHELALHLHDRFGDSVCRDRSAAAALGEAPPGSSPEATYAVTQAQMELDPLDGRAWFNTAIALNKMGHHADATCAFAFAASCQPGDVEAWANAFVTAPHSIDGHDGEVWMAAAGYGGLQSNGDAFLDAVEDAAAFQKDPEHGRAIVALLDTLRSTLSPSKSADAITVRIR